MSVKLDEPDIQKMHIPSGYERINNFNSQHCVTSDTEIIIVGTITPPAGVSNGYFYTASRNRIYGYIDEARGTDLNNLKKELNKHICPAEKAIRINDIKKMLMNNNIAFLDIMKTAIRKGKSPYDKDIKYHSLDFDAFKSLPKGVRIICNSLLAEKSFNEIINEIGIKYSCNYLSQRRGKKSDWIAFLK